MAVRRRPAWGAPGQHFLRSSRLAADLVEEAGVACGDLVVEVGGGTGMLTDALARTGARIVVLERGRFRVRERSVLRYYAKTIEHLLVTTGWTH